MNGTFLSGFSPSLMSPEMLDEILVGRGGLRDDVLDALGASIESEAKHQILLVGPRGIGKTHMVSLVAGRLQRRADHGKRFLLAWMREEEWSIAGLADLKLRILKTLSEEHAELVADTALEEVLEARQPEREIDLLLEEALGKRCLILVLENLEEVLRALGTEGVAALRAWIQTSGQISLLATNPGLFAAVQRRQFPLYGFFRVLHLEPLSFEEALELLRRLARVCGDAALAEALRSPSHRARVRALHRLSGGNPRVLVLLSGVLGRGRAAGLEPLLATLDTLTPYYQSQMAALSPQQRKLVEILADSFGPMTVKEVARGALISNQGASAALGMLHKSGFVERRSAGRESYYELTEPLLKLFLEVKRHRGGLARWAMEVMAAFAGDREEAGREALEVLAAALGGIHEREALAGFEARSETREAWYTTGLGSCLQHLGAGRVEEALGEAVRLQRGVGGVEAWRAQVVGLLLEGKRAEAGEAAETGLTEHPGDPGLLLLGEILAGEVKQGTGADEAGDGGAEGVPEPDRVAYAVLREHLRSRRTVGTGEIPLVVRAYPEGLVVPRALLGLGAGTLAEISDARRMADPELWVTLWGPAVWSEDLHFEEGVLPEVGSEQDACRLLRAWPEALGDYLSGRLRDALIRVVTCGSQALAVRNGLLALLVARECEARRQPWSGIVDTLIEVLPREAGEPQLWPADGALLPALIRRALRFHSGGDSLVEARARIDEILRLARTTIGEEGASGRVRITSLLALVDRDLERGPAEAWLALVRDRVPVAPEDRAWIEAFETGVLAFCRTWRPEELSELPRFLREMVVLTATERKHPRVLGDLLERLRERLGDQGSGGPAALGG